MDEAASIIIGAANAIFQLFGLPPPRCTTKTRKFRDFTTICASPRMVGRPGALPDRYGKIVDFYGDLRVFRCMWLWMRVLRCRSVTHSD